ncbi:Serine/threonine-protein phosphatase 2A activator 1 [Phlyctochytrium bullatum]|nr:Serine/threonine-protein phosphatase 2A activator 1 [Phlyctochytrium bullatum]
MEYHNRLKPKSVVQQEVSEYFASQFLYCGAINFIYTKKVKKGPFFEHSPILYDISGVASWSKVNGGMVKMYLAEVLQKFPVVQHLTFGSLLTFNPAPIKRPQTIQN